MKPYINNYTDLLDFLDEKVDSVNWDNFYGERKRPVPFITQNTMPDENLVNFLNCHTDIKTAVDFPLRVKFILSLEGGFAYAYNWRIFKYM